jgi:ubiquitin thioesterase OTU1
MDNTITIKLSYEDLTHEILLNKTDSFHSFKQKIQELLKDKLNITTKPEDISIRLGFPPKTIEGTEYDEKTIATLGISNNDLIRLTLLNPPSKTTTESNPNGSENKENLSTNHILYRKIIPADNSCLFNAINYAMNNVIDQPEIMRELIAVEITSNPDIYSASILEKEPFDYCEWIMSPDTWGGGIELSILSKCFQVRLAVVDINNLTIEYFGEGYSNIIYLLYDGIHYDVLVKKDEK